MINVIKKNQITSLLVAGTVLSFSFVTKSDFMTSNEITKISSIEESTSTFTIKNSLGASIAIETIDKVHKFEVNKNYGGFRCVTTGNFGSTDYGPYCELYFIFDNHTEMPHRSAVFHVGNLAKISSFKKVSEAEYQITGEMFSNGKFETEANVLITINASKVLEKEKKLQSTDDFSEGDMESQILVSIVNIN